MQTNGTSSKPLESLQKDLKEYKPALKEVSQDIIANKVSSHPIFIAHRLDVAIGQRILNHEELGTNWSISASMLEEFTEKQIILEDKKATFLETFKDPAKMICLFVVVEQGANFVFIEWDKI